MTQLVSSDASCASRADPNRHHGAFLFVGIGATATLALMVPLLIHAVFHLGGWWIVLLFLVLWYAAWLLSIARRAGECSPSERPPILPALCEASVIYLLLVCGFCVFVALHTGYAHPRLSVTYVFGCWAAAAALAWAVCRSVERRRIA